jgi:transcriptional regulator with XRE-family HTH domain
MPNDLGELIARRMRARGNMTGRELAERIGRSPSYVSQLVNGEKKEAPPPEVLEALQRELGIPIEESLRLWGYRVGATPRGVGVDPSREAVYYVVEEMTEAERLALADAGAILLRLRAAQRVGDAFEEFVPALP